MKEPRVVLFTCNWSAYSGLEQAGTQRLGYPASVHPLRVACLGQLSPGTMLRAFAGGADGVLLLGCPEGECHHGFGGRCARESFDEAKRLAALLGIKEQQFALDSVALDDGEDLVRKVDAFLEGLTGGGQG